MNWVELKDITINHDNKRVPLNSIQRAEKESNPIYPYIGANNIMGYIDEYIFDEKILCIAEDGGSWGRNETCAKIYNEKVWVNNHAHVITARENLILEYLMYYLNYTDLNLYINGATRGKLTKSSLNSIKIPLPPLEQQKKIAAILDEADAYRQKTKALIAKYDELTQSLFLDMFGDLRKHPKEAMKDAVKFIDYRGKSPNKVDSGIPLLTAKNVKVGYISEEPREYIPVEEYEEWMVRGFPKTGNVLFTTEAPLGQAALLPYYEKVAIAQRIICLQPKESLDSNYLLHTILSPLFQGELNRRATGSTAKGIRSKELAKIEIPIPPLNVQKEFNERVQAIEQQKAQTQVSLEKAEELFNSLLKRAFKGELV